MRLGEIRRMWMRMIMHADWLHFVEKRVFCVSVSNQHRCVETVRQKKVQARVPLLHVLPPCRCDRNNKGTWKKLASGPQPDNSSDRSQSTIAEQRSFRQEHVCTFCNMQQSSCNCIPPGVSELQQSGVFFFCQFWQIFTTHAHLETKPIIWGRSSPSWNAASVKTHILSSD